MAYEHDSGHSRPDPSTLPPEQVDIFTKNTGDHFFDPGDVVPVNVDPIHRRYAGSELQFVRGVVARDEPQELGEHFLTPSESDAKVFDALKDNISSTTEIHVLCQWGGTAFYPNVWKFALVLAVFLEDLFRGQLAYDYRIAFLLIQDAAKDPKLLRLLREEHRQLAELEPTISRRIAIYAATEPQMKRLERMPACQWRKDMYMRGMFQHLRKELDAGNGIEDLGLFSRDLLERLRKKRDREEKK